MGQEQSSPEVKQEVTEAPPLQQDDGVQSAASALSALMGDKDSLPPHDPSDDPEPSDTEAPKVEEAKVETPKDQPDPKAAEEAKPGITLKIGDKDYTIPADQIPEELRDVVKDGLLMRADYSRKTMEVAEQRKAIEAKGQKFEQAFQTVVQFPAHLAAIQSVDAQLQQFQDPGLWQRLAQEDPSGIRTIQARQTFQDLYNHRQTLTGELDRAQQQAAHVMQEQMAERLKAAEPKIKEAIPDYGPEKVKAMREFAKQYGATDADLDTIYDATPVLILDMAMKYQALQKQAAETAQKVEKLPPKVVRAGTSSGPQGPQVNQSALQRLKTGGKVEDAAAAIRSILG